MQRKLLISFIIGLAAYNTAQAQTETDTLHPVKLDELIISAGKFGEHKKNLAQSVQVINNKEIEWAMPQTSATMLEQTGNVFMQRSQAGGGSAVLRGFEANKILMVVDGVRMNNAIYRGGHLQNVITVDNNMLERTEVLYGPASTLYGSDALGGVIVFNSKAARLSATGKTEVTGNAMTRYSTANNEKTGHIDFNLGFKKFAALTSVTYSDFDDVRMGDFRNPFYGSFGSRDEYVDRINGTDSIVKNGDRNVQKQSGYSQVDIMEKLLYKPNWRNTHTLNLQYSTSSDIPRYDRLTDMRSGKLRYAEWYYGPQDRLMAAYQFHATDQLGFFDELKAGVNYQLIEESRNQRNRGSNDRDSRIENVGVLGYNIDGRRLMGKHELSLGIDGQLNDVKSTAHSLDIVTNEESPLDTRYPDGGSSMFYGAVYGQHIYKIINDKLVLNDGLRLNYVSLDATFNDKTFFPFPYNNASQQNIAWSGNVGVAYMPAERWRFAFNASTGFRAPNIDDIAKVFESAGGVSLVVPNPDLKPEYSYNLDLGITYVVSDKLKLEGTGYYTWLKDAIIQQPFTLGGKDSVDYNGKLTAVVANQNAARGFLYGFNTAITANLIPNVTLYSTINFTYARYFNAADVQSPLDHIPPVFGKTSIMYTQKRFNAEVFALYNGWKRLKDYSPSGEDNLAYATPNGMPAWYTLNLRAGYKVNKHFGVQLALENILDYNYRVFASGIHATGRNFVVTLRGHL